jgi:hypothetical protein
MKTLVSQHNPAAKIPDSVKSGNFDINEKQAEALEKFAWSKGRIILDRGKLERGILYVETPKRFDNEQARKTYAENVEQVLKRAIRKLPNMIAININRAGIRNLPKEIVQLKYLEGLILSGNHLTELPQGIATMHRLRILDVSCNHLTQLPLHMSDMGSMDVFTIVGNNFKKKLPERIGLLKAKRVVDLGGLFEAAIADLMAPLRKAFFPLSDPKNAYSNNSIQKNQVSMGMAKTEPSHPSKETPSDSGEITPEHGQTIEDAYTKLMGAMEKDPRFRDTTMITAYVNEDYTRKIDRMKAKKKGYGIMAVATLILSGVFSVLLPIPVVGGMVFGFLSGALSFKETNLAREIRDRKGTEFRKKK